MGIRQIALLSIAIILVIAIYLYGHTRFPESKVAGMSASPSEHAGNTRSGMSFSTLLSLAKKTLNADELDSVNLLTAQLDTAKNSTQQEKLLDLLTNNWIKTANLIVAGNYKEQLAKLAPNKGNLEETAALYMTGMQNTNDSLARDYAANKAISTFAALIQMDSTHLDYKVQQALCYIDGKHDVMTGVLMLKDVEKKDPNNETMNLTLGRLAVVSGQYDKAINRLGHLIQLHPDDVEAYITLAEAYSAEGKKEEAINVLEKCKSLLSNNADAEKQIDQFINQVKNS